MREKRVQIVLGRDTGRVACFLCVGDRYLHRSGSMNVDWCYASPKSVMLWAEGRGNRLHAADIIRYAQFLSEMLGVSLVDKLRGEDFEDVRKKRRKAP